MVWRMWPGALVSGPRNLHMTLNRDFSMRRMIGFALTLSLFSMVGCNSQTGSASLESPDQKASYGIGLQMGAQLVPAGTHLDMDAFMAGIRDGKAGEEPAISQEELQTALQDLNAAIQEEEAERIATEGAANAAEGTAFLEENASKDGIMVTESGLQYEVLREGEGPTPERQNQVSINYRGSLIDGTEFDSSYERGQPATFGVSGVIPGFSEGLQLMPVGSQYRFFIPPEIGYGPTGSGQAIGPNATLIFEVEMLEIIQ